MYQRKDCCGGPNAECQRQNSRGCKSRSFSELPQCVTNVFYNLHSIFPFGLKTFLFVLAD
jgi:hypothetical protein